MRPGIIILCVVVSVWAMVAARPSDARAYQHISNGGFENGLSGWSPAPGVAITITSDDPAEGGASAKLAVGAFAARIDYSLPSALGAGTYDASLRVRGAAGSVSLSITPSPQPRFEIADGAATAAWRLISGQFALSTAANATISIIIEAPPGTDVYLDEVRLDGTNPVTLTPSATRTPQPTTSAQSTPIATPVGASSSTLIPTETPATATDIIAASLRNPGFEQLDASGAPFAWEKFGGVLSSDSRARSGARAARLDSSTSSTKWVHQAVIIQPGSWYEFEAWVLHDDPNVAAALLRVSWYASADGSGAAISTADSTSTLDAPVSGYRYLTTGGVLAPPDARSARARVLLAPQSELPASIVVDDLWFGPGSPPPPTATPTAAAVPIAADAAESADTAGSSESRPAASRRSSARGQTAANPTGTGSSTTARVVINEVLYDPDSDGPDPDAEWVELYNASDAPADVIGWSLQDGAAADVLPPLVVPARGFAIVAANNTFHDAYPGVDVPVAVLAGRIGNALGNEGDTLALVDGAGVVVDTVSWGDDATAFDPPIDDVPAGHSIEREFAGMDSNVAGDFIDNERPSPGFGYVSPTESKPQDSGRSIRIIEGSGAGASDWLPWALAATAGAACVAMLGWRTLDHMRRARLP